MIMSPAQLDKLGANFGTNPVCVGPFKFVERVAQDRIVLQKSDLYYAKDKVHLDKIIYKPIPDGNIRVANLRSGDIQVSDQLQPSGKVAGPLANDPRVRKALELSIDRDALNKVVFSGLYEPTCSPIPLNSPYATRGCRSAHSTTSTRPSSCSPRPG
jgi:peptide/nickel transport system substrate-binding protein